MQKKKIAIIGSGSWGVALAIHLTSLGHAIKIWSFLEEEKDQINQMHTCKFLPNVVLPEELYATTSLKEAIQDSDYIVHVTPSKYTRQIAKRYQQYVTNQPIILCSKGMESKTLLTLEEVIKEELPNTKIGVLTGPSHAEEVSVFLPTVILFASKDQELLNQVQEMMMSPTFRIYISKDVIGAQIGGALKNIIALCTGIAVGMGLGDNTIAALLTRGLKEIADLGIKMGAQKDTFYGISGLGDLMVTCLSEHSRNRKAGILIGQGKSLDRTKEEIGMVIESIDNIQTAYRLGKKYQIEMPIIQTAYSILYDKLDPKEAVYRLMTRQKKEE